MRAQIGSLERFNGREDLVRLRQRIVFSRECLDQLHALSRRVPWARILWYRDMRTRRLARTHQRMAAHVGNQSGANKEQRKTHISYVAVDSRRAQARLQLSAEQKSALTAHVFPLHIRPS